MSGVRSELPDTGHFVRPFGRQPLGKADGRTRSEMLQLYPQLNDRREAESPPHFDEFRALASTPARAGHRFVR
jgi:hypothetical protein